MSKPKVFHVSTRHHPMWNGPKRYVRVYLYDTVEELRDAARRFHYFAPDSDTDKATGLFTPAYQHFKYAKDGSEIDLTDKHYAGMMRLCVPHLTYEVVAHECVHAACAIYRMDITKSVVLHTHCNLREEQFAYLAGQLTDEIMWQLRNYLGELLYEK